MFLRAGAVSLVLLLASRLLGLVRESAQAAAFGASAAGDVSVLMVHLPDLVASIAAGGALAYVLLPAWARMTPAEVAGSQRRVARWLVGIGLALALVWVAAGEAVAGWLVPGLAPLERTAAARDFAWSAAALVPALLATLWATRLQHERDFLGAYGANFVFNLLVVAALLAVAAGLVGAPRQAVAWVGAGLLASALLRLVWLHWRLQPWQAATPAPQAAARAPLPVWLWAVAAAGLPLALPFAARSLASQQGEGALATFNYAWKLIELPLQLAIQLVATLALGPIARALAHPETGEAASIIRRAFALAWVLASASAAALLVAGPALAQLLFGWGRMQPDALVQVADWARIGAWSLLPQALTAVALAVLAAQGRLRVGAVAYAAALLVLLLGQAADGATLMAWLAVLLACVCVAVLATLGRNAWAWLPWHAMLAATAAVLACHAAASWLPLPRDLATGLALALVGAGLPLAAAWWASADFRHALRR